MNRVLKGCEKKKDERGQCHRSVCAGSGTLICYRPATISGHNQ